MINIIQHIKALNLKMKTPSQKMKRLRGLGGLSQVNLQEYSYKSISEIKNSNTINEISQTNMDPVSSSTIYSNLKNMQMYYKTQ